MWHAIMNGINQAIFQAVLPLLASTLAGFGVLILKRWLAKLDVDLTADQQAHARAALDRDVRQAILRAEELSRQTPTLKGEDKLIAAATAVAERHPTLSQPQIEDAIHAALPEIRVQLGRPVPSTPGTFGRPQPVPGAAS